MTVSNTGFEVALAKGDAACQAHSTQWEDRCQDISANRKQWRDGERDHGCSGDDSGGTGGGEKTHNQRLQGNKHKLNLHQDEDVQYKMVPPDGGWGWMVVLGTFIIVATLPAVGPCFGVLFSGYLLGAGSSSTTTAWIFNLQCFLWFIIGLFTRPITHELGWRRVAVSGCVVGSLGLILCAFTPSPTFLFFSFSVMIGLGGGIVTCQCFTILPHYFDRLRGRTNAIMMSGICLGQIGWPIVSRYLQDTYGFRGATLIIGAVMFNSCIGASFFHPFEWHQKKIVVNTPKQQELPALPIKTKITGSPHRSRNLSQCPSDLSFAGSITEEECDGSLAVRSRLLERLEVFGTSASSSRQSSRCHSTLSLSSMDVGSLAAMPMDDEEEKANAEEEKKRGGNIFTRVVKSILNDLGVLKSLRASILCFGAIMSINGFLNFIMMVPFAMLEAGLSKDTSAWCLSVSAVTNLVTRFLVSMLCDFPRFNKRLSYMAGFALIASCMFAFTLFNTAEWLLVVMAFYGVGIGACMGIYNIIMIDVMGVENLLSVFGTANFCVAIGFIIIGPLIGFIRDVTQSYAVGMRITSGMLLMGLIAWMFMGVAERIDRRREESKIKKEQVP